MRRSRIDIPGVGRVMVTRTADVSDDSRRIYSYLIRDEDGELLTRGRDLRSQVSADPREHPGPREMARTLLHFLAAAPDSFNSRTEAWARAHDTELWLAADELEEEEL
jgi:hypothetical protein